MKENIEKIYSKKIFLDSKKYEEIWMKISQCWKIFVERKENDFMLKMWCRICWNIWNGLVMQSFTSCVILERCCSQKITEMWDMWSVLARCSIYWECTRLWKVAPNLWWIRDEEEFQTRNELIFIDHYRWTKERRTSTKNRI